MRKAQAKAPGKLYIAGEYAVVEPAHPAVIVAVDRFITVMVTPSDSAFGLIHSPVLSSDALKWERKNSHILMSASPKASIILAAITVAEEYLRSFLTDIPFYDIDIKSDMISDTGLKYGLGSSGAVTVALIQAILNAFSIDLDKLKLYKLATLAHLSLNSNGSFGDLAAASFTGWIAYASFDRQFVQGLLNTHTLTEVVETDWKDLMIEQLPPLKELSLLVGWTGSPSSTESLVKHVSDKQELLSYNDFLKESSQCVERLIAAFKRENTFDILKEVSINRQLLLKMSRFKQFKLETPLLSKLCSIAEKHHATAKTSGAGGGDCGIAFVPEDTDSDAILCEWTEAGITPLPLAVYTN